MSAEGKRPSFGSIVIALIALVGAIGFFGLRLIKTHSGRDVVANYVSPSENPELAANRDESIRAGLRASRLPLAQTKCGITPQSPGKTFEETLRLKAANKWPKYTESQQACLRNEDYQVKVGDYVD